MNTTQFSINVSVVAAILSASFFAAAAQKQEFSPRADEQQLPRAMHSKMKDRPVITTGLRDADIVGADNRAGKWVDHPSGIGACFENKQIVNGISRRSQAATVLVDG